MHMIKTDIQKIEKDNLKMIFDALDDEKDGEIELKEFVIQLKEKFDISVKIVEMEAIMKQIDLDYDGQVQFSEFLIAACNKRTLFADANVEKCFKFIDADGDGEISLDDMRVFLGEEVEEQEVVQIFNEADFNGDGGLEYDEFHKMMIKVLTTTEKMKGK